MQCFIRRARIFSQVIKELNPRSPWFMLRELIQLLSTFLRNCHDLFGPFLADFFPTLLLLPFYPFQPLYYSTQSPWNIVSETVLHKQLNGHSSALLFIAPTLVFLPCTKTVANPTKPPNLHVQTPPLPQYIFETHSELLATDYFYILNFRYGFLLWNQCKLIHVPHFQVIFNPSVTSLLRNPKTRHDHANTTTTAHAPDHIILTSAQQQIPAPVSCPNQQLDKPNRADQ